MSDNSFWITEIENKITEYITSNFPTEIKTLYPDIDFVSDESELATASFPTVFLHLLPMSEIGGDLQGNHINGVRATYEAQVFADTSKDDANIIMWHIVQLLKNKRFSISTMPDTVKEEQIYRSIVRATRVIGSGDTTI